jgi:hypothetical protein
MERWVEKPTFHKKKAIPHPLNLLSKTGVLDPFAFFQELLTPSRKVRV